MTNSRLNVRQDSVDLNDRVYQPPLIELPMKLEPTAAHRELIGSGGRFLYKQDIDAKCTGIATANAVDYLRIRQTWDGKQGTWDLHKRVSAVMLYRMGQSFDELLDEQQHGSTLRGVMRGFQHNGVCLKDELEDHDDELKWNLTIERCKQARKITLGGYARLQRSLLDYQTALKEVGAVVVSARTHNPGWATPKNGRIVFDQTANIDGPSHAFVLIGYNEYGFLVLNSQGASWGNWKDSSGHIWKGVALWHYEDWSLNIQDGWIIRLGVAYANEERALAGQFEREPCLSIGNGQYQGVTRMMIQGHYLHTRDGQFVQRGVFVSDKDTVGETISLLRSENRYEKLVIFVESGLGSEREMAERASIVTAYIKENYSTIFPLFIFWREDVQELVIDLLNARSHRINGITGGLPRATRSYLIRFAQDWLQPVWRTLEGEAKRAFHDDKSEVERGIGWWVMSEMLQAAVDPPSPMTIHFIVHGCGFLWLSALAERLHQQQSSLVPALQSGGARRATIPSIDLLAPIATMQSIETLARNLWADDNLTDAGETPRPKQIRVFTLPTEQEKASRLGGFEGSFLELARCAFPVDGKSPTLRTPNKLVGSRQDMKEVSQNRCNKAWLQEEKVEIFCPESKVEHANLMNDSKLIGAILKRIHDDFS